MSAMASWNAACAWGRLSLKVGVISPFSTLKGSGAMCTAPTWAGGGGGGPGGGGGGGLKGWGGGQGGGAGRVMKG